MYPRWCQELLLLALASVEGFPSSAASILSRDCKALDIYPNPEIWFLTYLISFIHMYLLYPKEKDCCWYWEDLSSLSNSWENKWKIGQNYPGCTCLLSWHSGKLRQEDHVFRSSLGNLAISEGPNSGLKRTGDLAQFEGLDMCLIINVAGRQWSNHKESAIGKKQSGGSHSSFGDKYNIGFIKKITLDPCLERKGNRGFLSGGCNSFQRSKSIQNLVSKRRACEPSRWRGRVEFENHWFTVLLWWILGV